MTKAHSIAALLFLGTALALPMRAEDPSTKPAPTNELAATPTPPPFAFQKRASARLDVLMVAVPEAAALPLLPQLRDGSKTAAAQASILSLIEKKQARLLDWPDLTLFDGQRSISESITEHPYITQLEPPPTVPSLTAPTVTGKPGAPVSDNAAQRAEQALATLRANGLVPTEFETRNTGSTLEAEVAFSPDQKAVSVQFSVQYIFTERDQEFPAGRTEKGEVLTAKHPVFKDAKVNTTVTLRDGERRLVYVGKPIEPGTEIIFFILGASLTPTAP